ncbi:MAG: hypothetical protein IVW56_13210 [Candidatus Binataceae bacterium]|nr:hypothetical protein [Candidatus Binataceae bacterium]
MVTQTSLVHELQTARRKGIDFILARQRADGAIGNPETEGLGPYYKALWALAAGGEVEAAHRLATWVARNVLAEDGDFSGPLRGDDHNYSYAYPNAWLICGAQKLGRFDITSRGMDFLLRLQHAEDGGFRIQRDREDAPQDLLCSSQAGNACLFTGHVGEAKNVGRFLRTVWDAQPDPEHQLFLAYQPGVGLRTEFPPERQRLLSIRADKRRQRYFNMGIAAAFLSRLTLATGDGEWLDLGKRYLELAFHVLDEMYETAQVGKVGWGAALVYAGSGDRRYLELAARVGEALIAQQTPEGAWDNTGGYTNDAVRTEVTCEFIVLLDEMIGGIAGA